MMLKQRKKSLRYRPGLTLLELIITLAIIMITAAVAFPGLEKYSRGINFQNKKSEVESIFSQTVALSRNPAKGVSYYEVSDEEEKFILRDSAGIVIETVELYSDQHLTSNYKRMRCNVPGNTCILISPQGTEEPDIDNKLITTFEDPAIQKSVSCRIRSSTLETLCR